MIRLCRLCFFGRKYLNVPLLCQRSTLLSKQLFVEFSGFIPTETRFEVVDSHQRTPNVSSVPAETSFTLSNRFLKDIARGDSAELLNSKEKALYLKSFFESLKFSSVNEIIHGLKVIVQTNQRPIEAVKVICEAILTKENVKFSQWNCSDFLFCLSKLHYRDERSIYFIIDYMKENSDDLESLKVIASLMHSFSLLRVRDAELFEMLVKSLLKHPLEVKTSLCALVSFSVLNMSSPHLDMPIKYLSGLNETDFNQVKDYVTFIWTCALLGKLNFIPEEQVKKILSPEFLEKLGYGYCELPRGLKWKLLNINAAVSLMPSYKGPYLHTLSDYHYFYSPIKDKKSDFLESVVESMTYMFGKTGNLRSLIDTKRGFYLDVECFLNPENSSAILSKSVQNLKLGIILLHYYDICTDGTVTGVTAFKRKILEAQDYKVVFIPSSEYPLTKKLSQKIGYLRKKIQLAVDTEEVSGSDKFMEKPVAFESK